MFFFFDLILSVVLKEDEIDGIVENVFGGTMSTPPSFSNFFGRLLSIMNVRIRESMVLLFGKIEMLDNI